MTAATPIETVPASSFDWSASSGPAAEVRRIVESAASHDGRSPLDEASLLSLRHQGLASSTLYVSGSGDALDGFALVNGLPATAEKAEVNLVVDPGARGRGIGTALAHRVLDAFSDVPLTAWSHGNVPGAAALAADLGFARIRDLWLMRRSLADGLPETPQLDGVEVRTFEQGRDEEDFLAINAEAFADHPEQGRMTRTDLDQRMAEPWFDPSGFFLAERSDAPRQHEAVESPELLGFHWTKVHRGEPPCGEVYVLGVSPAVHGRGLGTLLALRGLNYLRERGVDEVVLYVESDNAAAVSMYQRLGFTHADADTDVMYASR